MALNNAMFCLENEQATLVFGQHLGQLSDCRGVIFLHGDLGAGKTTLSRGILRGLGHTGAVKSPTFTLMEPITCLQASCITLTCIVWSIQKSWNIWALETTWTARVCA